MHPDASKSTVLDVRGLRVTFGSGPAAAHAVDGVDLRIHEGEAVALVGESGSGKSVTALALARLLPEPPGCFVSGEIAFLGKRVDAMERKGLRALRGGGIGYVFQEPATSLNPVLPVSAQVREVLLLHRSDLKDHPAEVLQCLRDVGLPDPVAVARSYPHQLSGGMQQRVMIAMALAARPRLLVADEPTTALDVTVQAQILELLASLQRRFNMALLLITHNLALVAGWAQRVHVLYAGRVVESGGVREVLQRPLHPYTVALLRAVPRLRGPAASVEGIEGRVPDIRQRPSGCAFHPRCPLAEAVCRSDAPAEGGTAGARTVRCHKVQWP